MNQETIAQIEHVKNLSLDELKDLYATHFGERPCSAKRNFYIRRIAWKIQSEAEGLVLSLESHRLAIRLASESDIRSLPPSGMPSTQTHESLPLPQRDPRLPLVGSWLTRPYQNRILKVKVLEDHFFFEGEHYKSLSAIAKKVTGSHWNGFTFFGLNRKGGQQ